MKIGLLLFALIVFAGLGSNVSYAQQAGQAGQGRAMTAAKSASASSGALPGSRRGSVGGPVNKGPSINGTSKGRKH